MRTVIKTVLIILVIQVNMNEIKAQTLKANLDQVELMKQFLGTWKGELGKDTFLINVNKAFGAGMISNTQIITKGICLDSIALLYGYNKKTNKYILAELIKSSPEMEVCNLWFTTSSTGETVIIIPENRNMSFKFEFKNQDTIFQTAFFNEKIVNEIYLTRIESEN